MVHTDANCRPALDDNQPRIAVGDRMLRINGLFRHGWLMAPALAEQAVDHIDGAATVDSPLFTPIEEMNCS